MTRKSISLLVLSLLSIVTLYPRNMDFEPGKLEVICGPMFAGKSEMLIHHINRAKIARQKVAAFKHPFDTRVSTDHIDSHSALSYEAYATDNPQEILDRSREADVVVIDEAQFYGAELIEAVELLRQAGKRVIVGGLDQDFKQV